jgi:hypothetical protein
MAIALASASVLFMMLGQMLAAAQPVGGPLAGTAARSGGRHDDGFVNECVALGLRPIPTKLALFLAGDSVVHIPTLKVSYGGKPLPRRCGRVHAVVAVRARVRFVKSGDSLEFGPKYGSSRWRVFWLGRTHVNDREKTYVGPAVTFNLGCVEKPQGWLRYEVWGRGGRHLARLVRPVPVTSEICER